MKEKKEKSKKALVIGIVAAVLVAATIACLLILVVFREDEIDRAERILRESDYLVTVKREGDDSPLELQEDLNARLRGIDKNSLNVIYILEFKEKSKAREYYELMKGEYTLTQTMKLHGRYVYYGAVETYDMLK
ncbi:MAG: hypothetical protein J6V07_06435 [Clostridia bacterium]|nr:hypothetical protein [Clostridia bacterium]